MQDKKSTEHLNDVKNDFVYNMVSTITQFMDKRFVDPLLGFIFPAFGDALMSVLALPYLYISIFKIKSLALTLAIILNTFTDILVGIIPYGIGDILDVFHRSYAKNMRLIDGYLNNDGEIIREVDRKAWMTAILIIATCFVIYIIMKLALSLIMGGFHLISSLFA